MQAFLLHNMQLREMERERDREDRKQKEALEKEERERKDKIEKEEREKKERDDCEDRNRRELREERKLEIERIERNRINFMLIKMMGGSGKEVHETSTKASSLNQVITVCAVDEGAGSQPLPAKFRLSSLETLLKFVFYVNLQCLF